LVAFLALFALVLVVLAEEQEKSEQTEVATVSDVAEAESVEDAEDAERSRKSKSRKSRSGSRRGRYGRRSSRSSSGRSRRSRRGGRSSRRGRSHQRTVRGWNKLANQEPGSVSYRQRRKYCRGSLRSRCQSRRGQRQIGRTIYLGSGRKSVCCLSRKSSKPKRKPNRKLRKARAKCQKRKADVRSFGRCPAGFRRTGRAISIGRGKKLSCCRFDRSPFRPMSEIPFLVSICQMRKANALRLKCRRSERKVGKPMPFGYKKPRTAVCCKKRSGKSGKSKSSSRRPRY